MQIGNWEIVGYNCGQGQTNSRTHELKNLGVRRRRGGLIDYWVMINESEDLRVALWHATEEGLTAEDTENTDLIMNFEFWIKLERRK